MIAKYNMMDFNDFSIKSKLNKIRGILIIVAIFFVAMTCFLFLLSDLNIKDTNMDFQDRYELISDGWHVTTPNFDEDVTLPVWVDLDPGDKVTLTIPIPESVNESSAAVVRNYHQILRAYVDGEMIYEFPDASENLTNSIITDDWNRIYFPENSGGKLITFELETGNYGYNGYINPALFGEDNSIMAYLQSKFLLPYALSIVLIVIGFLLIIVTSIYSKNLYEKSHLLLGFVFIAVGIWFADRSSMPVFMVGSNMKFFAAFSTLSLVPLLLSLYTGERFKEHNQTIVNSLIIGDIVAEIIFFSIIGLQIRPLHAVIPFVYLAILVSCIYLVYLMWYYAHGRGKFRLNQIQLNSIKIEFISAVITIIGSFISLFWDAFSSNNWSGTQRAWSGVGNIQMFSVIIFALFHFIILIYNSYYGVLESEATQKKLHASQLQLMMGQIQPHFMFNTLSSIRTLIKIDPDVAYDMIYNFSNYLRANVDNLTNLDGITFAEEVEHIKNYINIEEVRFGERLSVKMDIKESDFIVPPLSIQPLVENAIKHGVCKKPEGGTVWLRSYSNEKNYIVEVEDNGVGITPDRMAIIRAGISGDSSFAEDVNLTGNGSENHQSTGMRNITLRLKEISGATLHVTSEPDKGTTMRVVFPKDAQPKIAKPGIQFS